MALDMRVAVNKTLVDLVEIISEHSNRLTSLVGRFRSNTSPLECQSIPRSTTANAHMGCCLSIDFSIT